MTKQISPPRGGGQQPVTEDSILPQDVAPEFQALLSACRVFLGTEDPSMLRERLEEGLDLDRLLRLANRHGVMPLLYRSISQNCPQSVPQEWLLQLRTLYMVNAGRNMKITQELLRLLDVFHNTGIPAIPFKGPALAKQLYGDITRRTFSDLDIIVKKEDVLRAKVVLVDEGYKPEYELTPIQEKALFDYESEFHFNNEMVNVRIDLHWRVNKPCHFIEIDFQGFWSRVKTLRLEERDVLSPSPEDLLIALCIHNAIHHCNSLKLIGDIAGLIHQLHDMDWNFILSLARKIGIERIVLLNVELVKDLYRVKVPAIVENQKDESIPDGLESYVKRQLILFSPNSSRLQREIMFWLQARERKCDSIGCVLHLAFEPNFADWVRFPLPKYFHSLYYLIHPVRLICSYGIK